MQAFDEIIYAAAWLIFAGSIGAVAWCIAIDSARAFRRWWIARTEFPQYDGGLGVD